MYNAEIQKLCDEVGGLIRNTEYYTVNKQVVERKEDEDVETMWIYMKDGDCKHIDVRKSDILKDKL